MRNNWIKKLREQGACTKGLDWASKQESAQAAWNACERGDWMLWAWSRNHGKQGSKSHRRLVLCCVEIAKTGVKYIKNKEAKKVIQKSLDTTKRWARGEEGVTLEDVENAGADAWSFSASFDLASSEYADYTNVVANCAATGDASWTACFIDYSLYAHTISKEGIYKKCANIIRTIQPECPEFRRVTG